MQDVWVWSIISEIDANPQNNKKLPKGKDFSIIAIGKVSNNRIFKKEYL